MRNLENHWWALCFNDSQNLCCLARLGVEGSIRQIGGPYESSRCHRSGMAQNVECHLPFLKLFGARELSPKHLHRHHVAIFPEKKTKNRKWWLERVCLSPQRKQNGQKPLPSWLRWGKRLLSAAPTRFLSAMVTFPPFSSPPFGVLSVVTPLSVSKASSAPAKHTAHLSWLSSSPRS